MFDVVSADGGVVAFLRVHPPDPDRGTPIGRAVASNTPEAAVLENLRTGRRIVLSRSRSALRGGLALSADGTRVAFATREPLLPEDTNRARDVYVRTIDWGG